MIETSSFFVPHHININDHFEEDYGFFDILDNDEQTDCESITSSCKASPMSKTNLTSTKSRVSQLSTLSSLQSFASSKASMTDTTVICEVSDRKAPLSCRYFDAEGRSVYISLDGFRVVQNLCREEAEYKVNMVVDGVDVSCWRRYSDFKNLAEACIEYSLAEKLTAVHSPLVRAMKSWEKVEANRPWFTSSVKPSFIKSEMSLLKKFLSSVLFETPCYAILEEFVCQ